MGASASSPSALVTDQVARVGELVTFGTVAMAAAGYAIRYALQFRRGPFDMDRWWQAVLTGQVALAVVYLSALSGSAAMGRIPSWLLSPTLRASLVDGVMLAMVALAIGPRRPLASTVRRALVRLAITAAGAVLVAVIGPASWPGIAGNVLVPVLVMFAAGWVVPRLRLQVSATWVTFGVTYITICLCNATPVGLSSARVFIFALLIGVLSGWPDTAWNVMRHPRATLPALLRQLRADSRPASSGNGAHATCAEDVPVPE
jgi:hypothetical protein